MGGHDLRDGHAKRVFLFVVEEWEAVKPYGSVSDATMSETLANGFCYSNDNLPPSQCDMGNQSIELLTIVGNMYVRAPVSSNMITTTDTVMCMIPLKAAAAPKNAYVPGVIQGPSGPHAAKNLEPGLDSCMCWTKIPTIRPKDAPIAMEGTKIPAGTLHP